MLRQREGTTTCQVTRAVQTMSSFHQTSMTGTARKYFYSPKYFPRILGGIMLVSGIAGYSCMGYLQEQKIEERKRIYIDAYHNNNSNSKSNGESRTDDREDSRLVALARKMTNRMSSLSNINSVDSSNLQRQYTKFWWAVSCRWNMHDFCDIIYPVGRWLDGEWGTREWKESWKARRYIYVQSKERGCVWVELYVAIVKYYRSILC